MVENTVGKGEIARDKQFLLFPQCFQKACFPGASKGVIVWEWVKVKELVHIQLLHMYMYPYQTIMNSFTMQSKIALIEKENKMLKKGQN